jgi:ABC-type uncharacterized transport system permease subunit
VVSGALAGLAGGVEVLGVTYALYENLSPGCGYTAIAAALLAGLELAWVIASSALLGGLEAGAAAMQREAGVPAGAAAVIGALLVLLLLAGQVGTFAEGMSAGRGFIALAIVALGRWHPVGAVLASLLFGAASALRYLFQSTGTRVPYQLFLALPYALTLLVLATGAGRRRAPAALARRNVDMA